MEKIIVQWENYWETFSNSLVEMRKTGDFCDVTLVCEDGDVRAHGFVLSTGSNVFSKMLKSTNTNQPDHNKPNHKVQLKGISKGELNWILDYIYHGHTFLNQNEIESFLKKGNLLGLVGFQKEITDYNISQKNESLLEKFIKEESETPFVDTEIKEEHSNYLYNNKKYKGQNRDSNNDELQGIFPQNPEFLDEKVKVSEISKKSGKVQNKIDTIKQENTARKLICQNQVKPFVMVGAEKEEQYRGISNAKVPANYEMKIPLYAEERSVIQDDMQWTILDVLIRNSLTKVSVGCFLCNFCKKEFFDMTFLKVHMEAHFEEFPEKLKPAMVKMNGDKNWKCLECGRISESQGHMREHVEVHVPGLQYECPKCSVNLTSKNNLRSHLVKACPKKECVRCNFCDFSDKSQNVINTHTKLNHNESHYNQYSHYNLNPSSLYPGSSYKVYSCDQCEKYSTSKEVITIHKKRYHSIAINKASNPNESYTISPHIQSLPQDPEEDIYKRSSATGIANDIGGSSFKCDTCNFITFYSDQLARHTAAKHNKLQIMSSRACGLKGSYGNK